MEDPVLKVGIRALPLDKFRQPAYSSLGIALTFIVNPGRKHMKAGVILSGYAIARLWA